MSQHRRRSVRLARPHLQFSRRFGLAHVIASDGRVLSRIRRISGSDAHPHRSVRFGQFGDFASLPLFPVFHPSDGRNRVALHFGFHPDGEALGALDGQQWRHEHRRRRRLLDLDGRVASALAQLVGHRQRVLAGVFQLGRLDFQGDGSVRQVRQDGILYASRANGTPVFEPFDFGFGMARNFGRQFQRFALNGHRLCGQRLVQRGFLRLLLDIDGRLGRDLARRIGCHHFVRAAIFDRIGRCDFQFGRSVR